jgi:hypothetical protein
VDFLIAVWTWAINKFRGFLRCHKLINPKNSQQVNK